MRSATLLAAALAAASFFCLARAYGDNALDQAPAPAPAACAPEVQRCLDRLAGALARMPVSADGAGLRWRVFDPADVDPACALLLGPERAWSYQPRGGLR
jgi:hypothetical protein